SERRACADAGARASERSCARVDRARLQASRCTQGRARFAAERRSEIGRRTVEAGAEANSCGTLKSHGKRSTLNAQRPITRFCLIERWTLSVGRWTLARK